MWLWTNQISKKNFNKNHQAVNRHLARGVETVFIWHKIYSDGLEETAIIYIHNLLNNTKQQKKKNSQKIYEMLAWFCLYMLRNVSLLYFIDNRSMRTVTGLHHCPWRIRYLFRITRLIITLVYRGVKVISLEHFLELFTNYK